MEAASLAKRRRGIVLSGDAEHIHHDFPSSRWTVPGENAGTQTAI
jgi:hypothetical protein